MSKSPTWLIKRCAEGRHRDDASLIPRGVRGVYVLLKDRPKIGACDVIYVGMARRGIRGRLDAHKKGQKGTEWTHFSLYEVHDNITSEMIAELEGLLRHIYRWDSRANRFNVQVTFKALNQVRQQLETWDDWEWDWA
jgi:hypothetical protein